MTRSLTNGRRRVDRGLSDQCQMNESPTPQPSQTGFDSVVRTYERKAPVKFSALLPYKEGIAELRGKSASFRTITELLKQVNVQVSHDTVARFCHEIIGNEQIRKKKRKPPTPKLKAPHTIRSPHVGELLRKRQNHTEAEPPIADAGRQRGPRIADPKNV